MADIRVANPLGGISGAVAQLSIIKVDTDRLRIYANQIKYTRGQLEKLHGQIRNLYLKVGLVDLYNLVNTNIAIIKNLDRLDECEKYLRKTIEEFETTESDLKKIDPTDPAAVMAANVVFTTSTLGKVFGAFGRGSSSKKKGFFSAGDFGVAIVKGASKVTKFVKKKVDDAIDSYYSKGWVYKAVQYGKAVRKAAKGITKIVTAVGSIAGSGGMSAPIAILTIVSGVNDVMNAGSDFESIRTGNYDQIGKKNILKDTLVENGKMLGKAVGNEKLGEFIGSTTYYGVDLVTSLATLDQTYKSIKNLSPTNFKTAGTEIKEIMNMKVTNVLTTDMKAIKYTYSSTTNLYKNAKAFVKLADNTVDVGRSVNNIFNNGNSNPVIEFYDKIKSVKGKIGKGYKNSVYVTEKIFG